MAIDYSSLLGSDYEDPLAANPPGQVATTDSGPTPDLGALLGSLGLGDWQQQGDFYVNPQFGVVPSPAPPQVAFPQADPTVLTNAIRSGDAVRAKAMAQSQDTLRTLALETGNQLLGAAMGFDLAQALTGVPMVQASGRVRELLQQRQGDILRARSEAQLKHAENQARAIEQIANAEYQASVQNAQVQAQAMNTAEQARVNMRSQLAEIGNKLVASGEAKDERLLDFFMKTDPSMGAELLVERFGISPEQAQLLTTQLSQVAATDQLVAANKQYMMGDEAGARSILGRIAPGNVDPIIEKWKKDAALAEAYQKSQAARNYMYGRSGGSDAVGARQARQGAALMRSKLAMLSEAEDELESLKERKRSGNLSPDDKKYIDGDIEAAEERIREIKDDVAEAAADAGVMVSAGGFVTDDGSLFGDVQGLESRILSVSKWAERNEDSDREAVKARWKREVVALKDGMVRLAQGGEEGKRAAIYLEGILVNSIVKSGVDPCQVSNIFCKETKSEPPIPLGRVSPYIVNT